MSEQECDCGYDKGDGIEYVCYQCDACKTFIAKREYDGDQLRAEIETLREEIAKIIAVHAEEITRLKGHVIDANKGARVNSLLAQGVTAERLALRAEIERLVGANETLLRDAQRCDAENKKLRESRDALLVACKRARGAVINSQINWQTGLYAMLSDVIEQSESETNDGE